MKKLYAGLAAAALTATGIACTAGAANAAGTPWSLGYAPSGTLATAVSASTIYTAQINDAANTVDVTATAIATGVTTHGTVTLTPASGDQIDYIASIAVASSGTVLISAAQSGDTDSDQGVWVAQLDATTVTDATAAETISGADGVGVVGVSANGLHAALATGTRIYTFAPTDSTSARSPLYGDSAFLDFTGVAVTDIGDVHVVGHDDATGAPQLWSLAHDADASIEHDLANEPRSVAVAGSTVLVGETNQDDSTYALEELDGTTVTSVPLTDEPDLLAVSPDENTVFASAGYDIERVDLTDPDADPVLDENVSDTIFALIPTTEAFYVLGSAWVEDNSDAGGHYADATFSRLTKPGAVTQATQRLFTDGIDVEWSAPAQTGGTAPTYVVTATDQAAPHNAVTKEVTDSYVYLDADAGIQQGHTYDITVRAQNIAFQGDAVAVPGVVPGTATITVSGNPVVGGTLTAAVAKSTWPAGSHLSYQWVYSGGQFGGPIEDATKQTFSPTADLVGLQVYVRVTAALADHSPAYVDSVSVVVKAAPTATTPNPGPVKVTTITAKTMKAGSKKLTLTLPGVSSAPGKVKVYDGKKLIGTAKIKDGKLVLKLKKHLSKGKHKVKVKYAGSKQVGKFSKTVKVTVK